MLKHNLCGGSLKFPASQQLFSALPHYQGRIMTKRACHGQHFRAIFILWQIQSIGWPWVRQFSAAIIAPALACLIHLANAALSDTAPFINAIAPRTSQCRSFNSAFDCGFVRQAYKPPHFLLVECMPSLDICWHFTPYGARPQMEKGTKTDGCQRWIGENRWCYGCP